MVPRRLDDRAPAAGHAGPAAERKRPVSRVRGGICGTGPVKLARAHAVFPHARRRLVHAGTVGRPAGGRSRGRVMTRPGDRVERIPHDGQHRASRHAVISARTGFPASSNAASATATPSKPGSSVAVSSSKPVAFRLRGRSSRSNVLAPQRSVLSAARSTLTGHAAVLGRVQKPAVAGLIGVPDEQFGSPGS